MNGIMPTVNRPIILASASPRRAHLLRTVGLTFQVEPSDIPEPELTNTGSDPAEIAMTAAEQKARHVAANHSHGLIIAADTVVASDGKLLGKPETRQVAREMLEMLSGGQHQVYTGVALIVRPENITEVFVEKTDVCFRKLSSGEIEKYLDTDEPWDKAGAYGIQGMAGLFVREIHGDYNNVVGFPLTAFYEALLTLEASKENEGFIFG